MPYFEHHEETRHQSHFAESAEHLLDTDDSMQYDTDDWDTQESIEERRDRLRLLFGAGDLFGTVLGALCILALLALLISLGSWVWNDLSQSFSILIRF